MNFLTEMWEVVSAFLVFVFGIILSLKFGRIFGAGFSRVASLYMWHSIFCILACWYSLNYISDAFEYYEKSNTSGWAFGLGTGFVDDLSKVLRQIFGLSYIGMFFVFNIFGVIGLLAFDSALRAATFLKGKKIKALATVVIFLPSLSYWTSAIGKDSISFMAVGLALWCSLRLRQRKRFMFFAILAMMLVRPHIALIMIISVMVDVFFISYVSGWAKVLILFAVALMLSMLFPYVLDYAGYYNELNFNDISKFVEIRQEHNLEGGGGINISDMNLLEKMLTYMFRPFLFDVYNIFSAAAAFDNVILFGLFAFFVKKFITTMGKNLLKGKTFLWIYMSFTWILLASTTSNMGIALRQKWMFVPFLLFMVFSSMKNIKRSK